MNAEQATRLYCGLLARKVGTETAKAVRDGGVWSWIGAIAPSAVVGVGIVLADIVISIARKLGALGLENLDLF